VFHISIWGLGALLEELSPPKSPGGDGIGTNTQWGSSLLSFHMTQLLNRNNTESRCAKRKPIVSGNQNKWNHNGKI